MNNKAQKNLQDAKKLLDLIKRNMSMLESLDSYWTHINTSFINKHNSLKDIKVKETKTIIKKIDSILTKAPTYYNNNAEILYKQISEDMLDSIHELDLTNKEQRQDFYKLDNVNRPLHFSYLDYLELKKEFEPTLNSINYVKNKLKDQVKQEQSEQEL